MPDTRIVKKILFTVFPRKGHINPALGPAQWLMTWGHQVTWLSRADISKYLSLYDLSFDPAFVSESFNRDRENKLFLECLNEPERIQSWIRDLLLKDLKVNVSGYKEYFKNTLPDVVVADPMYYAPIIACEQLKIPWVAMSNCLNMVLNEKVQSPFRTMMNEISCDREKAFSCFNSKLDFRLSDALSPYLNTAFTTPEVCGSSTAEVELIGPSFPKRSENKSIPSFKRKSKKALVYVAFGSQLSHWPELYDDLIAIAETLDFELCLSAGPLASELAQRDSPQCQIFDYAPQHSVLKEADLFLSHGGANSFMEAIAFNVPTILSPIAVEQFHQAYFHREKKLGKTLILQDLSKTQLKELIENSLSSKDWHSGLAKASASYQRDGAKNAARKILEIV